MPPEDEEIEQPTDELEEEAGETDEDADAEEDTPEEESAAAQDALASEVEAEDDEPAQVFLPQGEGPATAKLREMLDPDVNAAVQAAIAEQVNRAMQTFGVTQASYTAAAAAHPEVFRKYGGKIQMALAMFPEHERHTRKSVDLAITLATIEDKAGKPEFARELLKIAQQLNGGTATAAPKPPKEPIPAASRPPSPSSGVRSQAVSRRESTLKLIMKDANVTKAEAEELMKGGR